MNERAMQFRVGVVILATVLIGTTLVLWFRGPVPLFQSTYTVYIKFSEAPGVTTDTPVRSAGIRIGRVRSVRFAENDEGVVVTADLDKDRPVYRDEQCEVVSSLLLGDTALEFVHRTGTPPDRTPLSNDTVIQGQVGPDMTGTIAGLQKEAVQTLDTVDKAAQELQAVLSRINRLIETKEGKIDNLVDETSKTMRLMQGILGDPKLREAIDAMPAVLGKTQVTVERMGDTFSTLNDTFTSLNRDLKDIEPLADRLRERGPALVDELDTGLKNVDQLTGNLLTFSEGINDTQGSVGALLHDKELYQHVNHLVQNLDEMTRELKPVVSNVQIFTDKIARHPSELGVRGAIKKDSGLKEVPANENDEATQPQARRWPLGGSGSWSIGQGR